MKPQDRWDTLTMVLQYDSSIEEKVFTPFERMQIHKERAHIIRNLSFEQNEALEEKIENTIKIIEAKEWQPKKFND